MPPSVGIIQDAHETNTSPRPDSGLLTPSSTTPAGEPWSPASVLDTIPTISKPTPHTSSPVPFFHLLERLKTTKREGWRRFGIAHGESIADHMYRMSLITMLAPSSLSSRLDVPRCTKMALVHDMAESLVGDITPVDGVLKSEKNRREAATMEYICRDLLGGVDNGDKGRELRAIWQEYEDGETLEAKFVHDVDKIELVLQMVEYEKQHGGRVDLGEFAWVGQHIVLPEVAAWCRDVLGEREAYWESIGRKPCATQASPEKRKMQDQYYGTNGTVESVNGHKP